MLIPSLPVMTRVARPMHTIDQKAASPCPPARCGGGGGGGSLRNAQLLLDHQSRLALGLAAASPSAPVRVISGGDERT
jgi:hypothetical protein